MIIVNTKPFADATDATPVTVIGVMTRPVVVEFANGAKVARKALVAGATGLGHRLVHVAAVHAGDKLSGVTVDLVCFVLVMAPTTGVVFTATGGLDPAAALVVVATRARALAGEDARRGFPIGCAVGVCRANGGAVGVVVVVVLLWLGVATAGAVVVVAVVVAGVCVFCGDGARTGVVVARGTAMGTAMAMGLGESVSPPGGVAAAVVVAVAVAVVMAVFVVTA